MNSCVVGHNRGIASGLALGASAWEAFSSSLAPTSREMGAWLLVRPKYPVLVSVICTPTAEQKVSVLAMRLAWDFSARACVRAGPAVAGFAPRRDVSPALLS